MPRGATSVGPEGQISTTVWDVARSLAVECSPSASNAAAHGPLSDAQFSELIWVCEQHRLLGALVAAVESRRVEATDGQRGSLEVRALVWLSHSLEVERVLLRLGEVFDRVGIEWRVLKGVALAHLVYADPAERVFADLDVLVPSDQFDEALRSARAELGGVQPVAELRPGFDREFGKDALIQVGTVEVDLHRTFVTGAFGLTIPLAELFADSTPVSIGGRTCAALGPSALLMHACFNAALGDRPVRLAALRDLLLVWARSPLTVDEVAAVAARWKAEAVVQHAARTVIEVLGLPPTHPLAPLTTIEVPRRQQWALRSYLTSRRSYTRPLASLLVIKGVRRRARYVRAIARPSTAYLQSRGWSEGGHLRRAFARLVGRTRG